MRSACGPAQRKIRQEGHHIRAPGALLVAIFLTGCSGPSEKQDTKETPKEEAQKEPERPTTINLGEGSGERFGGPQNRERLWTVKWKSAVMDFYQAGKEFTGTLSQVSGTIFDQEKTSSTFEAQTSKADKNKEVLILEGKVKVVSQDPKMTLTCDRVRYDAASKIIKAQGRVLIVGASGKIDGLNEMWTTPELRVVATPDAFDRRLAK